MRLAITSIQRNRAPWIKEWMAFHYLVGFRKFYIFLHNCSDDSEKILRALQKKIDIKIFILDPNIENPQLQCYLKSYSEFGDSVDWMAFIDGDEFLFPTSDKTVISVLKKYSGENISALGVYWSCFGSSGHIKEPAGLVIENYRHRAADGYHNNRHIKSIIKKGQYPIFPLSPHLFQTPLGTYDESLRLIEKGWTDYEPSYNYLRINHYVTQSRSFFLNFKSQVAPPDGALKRDESFWEEHDKNDVLDNSMNKFIKPLKELLNSV
jgi:hypothetical protein